MDSEKGKGGSYVRDPVTGVRTLVERTEIPEPTPVADEATEEAAAPAAKTRRAAKPAETEGTDN